MAIDIVKGFGTHVRQLTAHPVQPSGKAMPGAFSLAPDSLLFDIEMVSEEQTVGTSSGRGVGGATAVLAGTVRRHLSDLVPTETLFEARLLRDAKRYKRTTLDEEGCVDTVVLASKLAAVGYRVYIRTAIGGGIGLACFRNLHHEFLVVRDDQEDGFLTTGVPAEFIVDPQFREQFALANATPMYREVLEAVPEVFVGSPAKLKKTISVLSPEMAAVYKSQSVAVPPWRNEKSLLSKWLPARRRDTIVDRSTMVKSASMPAVAAGAVLASTKSPTAAPGGSPVLDDGFSSPTTILSSSAVFAPTFVLEKAGSGPVAERKSAAAPQSALHVAITGQRRVASAYAIPAPPIPVVAAAPAPVDLPTASPSSRPPLAVASRAPLQTSPAHHNRSPTGGVARTQLAPLAQKLPVQQSALAHELDGGAQADRLPKLRVKVGFESGIRATANNAGEQPRTAHAKAAAASPEELLAIRTVKLKGSRVRA